MADAWVFQNARQVKRHGTENASWGTGWYAPDGRKCSKFFGKGARGKKLAERYRRKVEAELMTGPSGYRGLKGLWCVYGVLGRFAANPTCRKPLP